MDAPRTFWHLAAGRRRPTEYEIASSQLDYWTELGFETRHPAAAFQLRHGAGSELRADWTGFADPRATTYASYVAAQRDKKAMIEGIMAAESRTAPAFAEEWWGVLRRVLAPMRYPAHAFQMLAAQAGHLAPGSRVTIALLFQAADEMRRVHRLAERLHALRRVRPDLADGARASWEDDPAWQPLREMQERLLTTWDWGETFTALDLVLKPLVDDVLLVQLAGEARRHGDHVLAGVLTSLSLDARWHVEWSAALARHAVARDARNRDVIDRWARRWSPLARAAAVAVSRAFLPSEDGARLDRIQAGMLDSCGLAGEGAA
jgi:toluene monooxygenase system protein E